MSSDQDGFKIPAVPISRAKPHEEGGHDDTVQHETDHDTEQSSVLDDPVTTQTEDTVSSKSSKVEQARSANEGDYYNTNYRCVNQIGTK